MECKKNSKNLHFWEFWAKMANFGQFLNKMGKTGFFFKNVFGTFFSPLKALIKGELGKLEIYVQWKDSTKRKTSQFVLSQYSHLLTAKSTTELSISWRHIRPSVYAAKDCVLSDRYNIMWPVDWSYVIYRKTSAVVYGFM